MTRREVFGKTLGVFGVLAAGAYFPKLTPPTARATVDKEHPFFSQIKLTDKWKHTIPLCFQFNMDDEVAGVYISVSNNGKSGNTNRVAVTGRTMAQGSVAKAYAHMPGCKLRWRDNGKPVTREEVLAGKRNV